MPRSKARRNLPQTAMAAWRRLEAAKASQTAGPSSAEARGKEMARMLGLSFTEYRQALAAQEETDKLSGRKPVADPPTSTPLDGIYNLFVHKLYREGGRIVNERGDGNCMFRAIARQIYGDEGRYTQLREELSRYYLRLLRPRFSADLTELFTRYGDVLVQEYIEDWYQNRTIDKLSADQKKRVDEILEKLKPFDVKNVPSMNASKQQEYAKLSKDLSEIYREGAPVISVNTDEEKRDFMRMYAARVGEDGFWGGEAELYSLSLIYGIDIYVYPSDITLRYQYRTPNPPPGKEPGTFMHPQQILLLFSGRNHYKSILPPRLLTVVEWAIQLDTEGVRIDDLREYGIAEEVNAEGGIVYNFSGNFLSGKPEDSPAVARLQSAYETSGKHRENWKHLAHLAYLAAQRMRPSTVDPEPPAPPLRRGARGSASGSRRGSASRPGSGSSRSAGSSRPGSGSSRSAGSSRPGSGSSRSAGSSRPGSGASRSAGSSRPGSGASRSAGSSRPGSGASRSTASPASSRSWRRLATPPPLPPRRPQPPPSGFVLPVGALLPGGKRSLAHPPAAPPISNFAKNPLFNKSATRRNTAAAPAPKRAAAPPPLLRAAAPRSPPKGWWARFLGMTGTRRNRVSPQPVLTIPGIPQQVAAYQALPPPPQVPPPPREPPTLQQRAAAAQWERARFAARLAAAAQLPETRAAAIQAQQRRQLLGPPPGTRPPPHLPPLRGPNGQLIPKPPLYPKPKGGRRLTRRKIGKGRRYTRRS